MTQRNRLKALETRVRGRRRVIVCEVAGQYWQPAGDYFTCIHDYDADGNVCAPAGAKRLTLAQVDAARKKYDVWLMKWYAYDGNARDAEPML